MLADRVADYVEPSVMNAVSPNTRKSLTATVFFACSIFLYLQVFVLPAIPRTASGDQSIYVHHGVRMSEGELIYRDYDHFTTPGADTFYAGLFKLFGVKAWIPQAMLVLLGVSIAWLGFTIARSLIPGFAAYLPSLLFLILPYSGYLDATHHWYSTTAATSALAVVMRARSAARVLAAGFLWGIAGFFTQSACVGALGLGLFLVWEKQRRAERLSELMRKETFLFAGLLSTTLICDGYFIWKVGFSKFWYFTVLFVAKYYPADYFNSWRVFMIGRPSSHPWANWPDLMAFFFIHVLVPLIYILFLVRWWQEKDRLQQPWDDLMLINITGICMLLTAAPAPAYTRLYVVSMPALILLVWFLKVPYRAERILLQTAWAVVVVLAIIRPIATQTRWKAILDVPTGRTAFFDPVLYQKCKWLSQRTQPGDFFFGDQLVSFILRLRNAGRVPFLRPTDYTRPEEVQDAVDELEKHQVRFVSWYRGLDGESQAILHPSGDHLGPIRSYLREHYVVAQVFSNGDKIWERKH